MQTQSHANNIHNLEYNKKHCMNTKLKFKNTAIGQSKNVMVSNIKSRIPSLVKPPVSAQFLQHRRWHDMRRKHFKTKIKRAWVKATTAL